MVDKWALAKLVHELGEAADPHVERQYTQAGGRDEAKYPTLPRIIKVIKGEERWRQSPNTALIGVLRDAIAQLPPKMSGRLPEHWPNETGHSMWEGVPERHMAEILHGFRDEEVPARTDVDSTAFAKTYQDDYLPAAYRLAGAEDWSKSSRGKMIKVLRQDLAIVLLDMEAEAIAQREAAQAKANEATEPVLPEFETLFIDRDRLFVEFMQAWCIEDAAEGEWPIIERICLVGDVGTGKTRFLRQMLAGSHAAWVNAEANETMVPGMMDLLREYVEDVSNLTEASLIKQAFGRLLAHPDGPPLVVIDGIPDPVTIDSYIPRTTQTHLVIISRKRPPKQWSPIVEVGVMTEPEATTMASTLLPDASENDCQALAIMLGRLPLLIEHACAFLGQDGNSDIQAFCAAVGQDITTALSAISDSTDRALTAIYRRYVARLTDEAPESLRLLELLSFTAHLYIPPEYLMSFLLGVPYITKELLARAYLAYRAAIRPLEGYSLVKVDNKHGIFIRPLVQRILRRIFADRLVALIPHAPPKVDRKALYDANWNAYTVSGREICNRVLLLHVLDAILLMARVTQTSAVNGIQWELTVERFRDRNFRLELVLCVSEGRVPSSAEVDRSDWEVFMEPAKYLPELQANELLAVAEYLNSITWDGPKAEQGTPEWEESFAESMLSLRLRHEDSPLGQLDLGLLDPTMIDTEDAEGAKQYLRELFFPKDENQESRNA